MAHSHGLEPGGVPERIRSALTWVAAALAVATVIGVVALWPDRDQISAIRDAAEETRFFASDVYAGTVVEVADPEPCGTTVVPDGTSPPAQDDASLPPCVAVTFRVDQGPDEGEERVQEFQADDPATDSDESATSPELSEGDAVVLNFIESAEGPFDYQYADRQRRGSLVVLFALFVVVVLLLGAFRGLLALLGLGASLLVVLAFVVPGILSGQPPVLVAVVGASAVAFVALYVAHGFRPLTTVALLGTLASLALVVLLSVVFTAVGEFTGFVSEESIDLTAIFQQVEDASLRLDARGLLLAGAVIGALGAIDDMTVTQASSVAELRAADPTMSRRGLFRASMRIGRDHVASTVNTLALAYAGAAMPLLILFVVSAQSLGTVANNEIVASEILRTLVGSIGLVASVPITTWLATLVVAGPTEPVTTTRRERRERREGRRGPGERLAAWRARRRPAEQTPDLPPPEARRADENEEDFWSDRLEPDE